MNLSNISFFKCVRLINKLIWRDKLGSKVRQSKQGFSASKKKNKKY
jgi:hypothetical protein